ncbi:extracellular solute-binding protein [Bacillus sp. MRMR6]|uniref:extracellular solute-binding protein n=1 Tax=Bacillus sp. MRMR6 TaxID=1928617 RepID=UPI000950B76A|nr:extracellular solute-binding protein [Bacillus sp. MRMR6]OLS35551.1 peptide ABC transporter substrate-binding protein [Bacillus sp. MRMR6]
MMQKNLCVLLIWVLIVPSLSGCLKQQAVGEEISITNIDWMTTLYEEQPPNDKIIKEIEKLTNTKLEITWVPDAIENDRVYAALASGKLPKIVTLTNLKSSSVLNSFKSDMFWEIGPYIHEYPNLREMNETVIKNILFEGKLFGIYRERPLSRQGVIIRTDWLENVGLAMPKTVDDLYQIAHAFTFMDPDQNGNNDTIGFTDRYDLTYGVFKTLSSYMGTPNEWGIIDGKLVPDFETEEYMKTMEYMKSLYDGNLINRDFPITSKTQQQDLFIRGKAGIYVGNMVDAINMKNAAMKLDQPFEIDVVNRIKGTDGEERVWASGGHAGMFVFPKSSIKTEDELKKILFFMDRMIEEDIVTLLEIGIEGVHYQKSPDGSYLKMEENLHDLESNVKPYQSLISIHNRTYTNTNDPLRIKFDALVKDNESISISNPAEPLFSPTFSEKGSKLQNLIDAATINYIIGKIDKEEFYQEVQTWRMNGGNEIIYEFNAQLNATQ